MKIYKYLFIKNQKTVEEEDLLLPLKFRNSHYSSVCIKLFVFLLFLNLIVGLIENYIILTRKSKLNNIVEEDQYWNSCHYKVIRPSISKRLWKDNRERLMFNLNQLILNGNESLFQGNEAIMLESGKMVDEYFRPASNFAYVCGTNYANAKILITLPRRSSTSRVFLFLPKLNLRQISFEGPYPDFSVLKDEYMLNDVLWTSDYDSYVSSVLNITRIHTLEVTKRERDTPLFLLKALIISRSIKSSDEIQIIRYATSIAANAHAELMRRSNIHSTEESLLSLFTHLTSLCGCTVQSYAPIVGNKEDGAILHYQPLNQTHSELEVGNGIVLVDAAGKFNGYASDITRTFPIRKMTDDIKLVYNIVYNANMVGIKSVKPGVSWALVERNARVSLLEGLLKGGFVNGTIEEIIASDVHSVFMPHGLGHSVGLDVHDNIYTPILMENQVFTIEPGVYFNAAIFEAAKNQTQKSRYINWEKVSKFIDMKFGGIRLEDVVLVTKNGNEVLSIKAPKRIEDIESILNNKKVDKGKYQK
jgi:Xaa-Pro dipeptidase